MLELFSNWRMIKFTVQLHAQDPPPAVYVKFCTVRIVEVARMFVLDDTVFEC